MLFTSYTLSKRNGSELSTLYLLHVLLTTNMLYLFDGIYLYLDFMFAHGIEQ